MTMGERIQELRKERNLSQEALGDALGVSRQAISKWEADAAIPEVEKLVAMSRLFGVSVGAILGVEPEEEPEKELTDRELRAVEAIVGRYVAESERRRPKPHRWPWLVAGAAAVAVVIVFAAVVASQFGRVNDSIQQLQNSTDSISAQVNGQINSQINSLTGQLKDILEEQDSLLAESGHEILEYLPEQDRLLVELHATPKQYTDGVTARFLVEGDGFETVAADGMLQDTTFSCRVELPPVEEARVKVIFDDGAQRQTQELTPIIDLASAGSLHIYGNLDGGYHVDQKAAAWCIDGYVNVSCDNGWMVKAQTVELCLLRNGKLEEVIPVDTEVPGDAPDISVTNWQLRVPLRREIPVSVGDTVILAARATDNYGKYHYGVVQGVEIIRRENGILELSFAADAEDWDIWKQ